ncbi:endoglucanase C307 [Abditibacteriota bacterium]|nr:endoglucanase C307 [Abditibacteriota bacterium]
MTKRWGLVLALLLMSSFHARAQTAEPGVKKGDIVLFHDFDDAGAQATWKGTDTTRLELVPGGTGRALYAERIAPDAPSTMVNLDLPIEKLRGCQILIEAQVKAEGVSVPPQSWNGIKVMLHSKSPAGDNWPQQNLPQGSFDWQKVRYKVSIPADATEASLVLGLEAVTGKAWFDNVKVSVISLPRVRPATPPTGPRYTGHGVDRLRGTMISTTISEQDLRDLASWNANHVRWQLTWNGFPSSPADTADLKDYEAWLEGALKHLDSLLPVCRELGIHVLVDLHTPPGGRNAANECRLFKEKKFQDEFVRLWEGMARRYKGEKMVWGYDLVNEPVEGDVADGLMDWHDLALETAKKVQAIDPDHALIIEGAPWGGPAALADFEPLPLPNIVYSFHMYEPHEFTHQNVYNNVPPISYPGSIGGKPWDKEQLRRAMQPVIDWQRDYNVAVYVGEFSAIRWAPGDSAASYLRDCIDIFEENHWDWAYHAFREWPGWSVEHTGDKDHTERAAEPTSRQKLLMEWFAKNQKESAVPVAPLKTGLTGTQIYPRWLVIGDSITAHGPSKELSWTEPTRGMAASTVDADYVHQLQHLLRARDPHNATELKIFGRFARLSAGTIEQMNTASDEIKAWNADLVTVQLGENDNLGQIGRAEFERRYRTLLDALLVGPKHPRIVCTGVWNPGGALDANAPTQYQAGSESRQKDDIIEALCHEKGLTFVPVAPFAVQTANRGAGQNDGVRWHPNDKGMIAYAQAIFSAL